ncbi:MAG: HPr kinase/phosphatase C-terminal domain-containing protein [Roseovarius sp.]
MPGEEISRFETDGGFVLHASCVAFEGRAVLIRGASGSGKSGLALQLIALGATLVADDRTRLRRAGERLIAEAPETIRGRIEARQVGLLRVPHVSGVPVALVIDMDAEETERLPPLRQTEIAGLALPLLRKSPLAHFPAAIKTYLCGQREA